jgi:hypothetical protein
VPSGWRHSCPTWLGRLRHWHALRDVPLDAQARLAQLSASSADRAPRPYRTREPRRGLSTTRPGTLLKQQIAMRTFAEWTDQARVPGDGLVAHCGWSGAGQFLYTLRVVDMATELGGVRWAARQALGDGLLWLYSGCRRICRSRSWAWTAITPEFINQVLLA